MNPRIKPNNTGSCPVDTEAQGQHPPRLQSIAIGMILGALLSTSVFADDGADVSTDEIYADGVTLTTADGNPLDMNGDGNTDLAVASNRGGTTERSRYYLGNGDGTFVTPGVELTGAASSEIAAADMNGDALIDLAQGRRDLTDRLHLGDGVGGILSAADISAETNRVLDVALGDLDNDGDLDIVMGNGRSGGDPANPPQVNRFYLNDNIPGGTTTFAAGDITADADDTRSIALADIDGDGNLDVIAGNDETTVNSNRIYLNLFASGTTPVSFAPGVDFGTADDQTSKILIGDLDNDGDPDIVVLNHVSPASPGTNRFFLNESTPGILLLGAETDVSADIDDTGGGALADFDGDGDLDLAVANLLAESPDESSRSRLYLNQFIDNGVETGTVSFAPAIDISADEQMSRSMAAADINGDGHIDIVVGNQDDVTGVSPFDRRYLNNGTADPFTNPSFSSTPVTDATEDVAYTYNITTTASDVGDPVVITAPTLPAWLTLTDNGDGTATLTGTPADTDVGDHPVSLEVSDGTATSVQDFTITVTTAGGNTPPEFTSTPVTDATEGTAYTYNVTTSDADSGDTLTITAPTVPAWLSFTDNGDGTATLTGTPADTDVGDHDVTLEVSDGTDAAMQAFTVTVTAAGAGNNAPSFTSDPVTAATEGAVYEYDVTTEDADAGDTLTITAPTLPGWLTLTDNGDGTATLTGTPGDTEVGDHDVSLQVSDGTDTAVQNFTVTVEAEAAEPPQEFPPPPSSGGGSYGLLSLVALLTFAAATRRRRRAL